MKVYREETPRKGKTLESVESQVRVRRTTRQALKPVSRSFSDRAISQVRNHQESRRRAARTAWAAGDAAWRQISRVNTASTPPPSHSGPKSHAPAAKAK